MCERRERVMVWIDDVFIVMLIERYKEFEEIKSCI